MSFQPFPWRVVSGQASTAAKRHVCRRDFRLRICCGLRWDQEFRKIIAKHSLWENFAGKKKLSPMESPIELCYIPSNPFGTKNTTT